MRSTVKFFLANQGYGFLKARDGDVFVHVSDVEGGQDLAPGDIVEYQIDEDEHSGRKKAVNVRCLHRSCDDAYTLPKCHVDVLMEILASLLDDDGMSPAEQEVFLAVKQLVDPRSVDSDQSP